MVLAQSCILVALLSPQVNGPRRIGISALPYVSVWYGGIIMSVWFMFTLISTKKTVKNDSTDSTDSLVVTDSTGSTSTCSAISLVGVISSVIVHSNEQSKTKNSENVFFSD